MTTVRSFSAAGPCLTRGKLVKQTPHFFVAIDRDGKQIRLKRDRYGLNHTEPCVSCRDHERSQYPDGYQGLAIWAEVSLPDNDKETITRLLQIADRLDGVEPFISYDKLREVARRPEVAAAVLRYRIRFG